MKRIIRMVLIAWLLLLSAQTATIKIDTDPIGETVYSSNERVTHLHAPFRHFHLLRSK